MAMTGNMESIFDANDLEDKSYNFIRFFELPNLVSSAEQAHEIMQPDTSFRTLLDSCCQDLVLRLAAIEPSGFWMLISNKEASSYEDLAGRKLRIREGDVYQSYWEQWGASPTPLPWAEVYLALMDGTLEAATGCSLETVAGADVKDAAKYLINTKSEMEYTAFLMNEEYYQSLPDTYQEILDQVAEEISLYAYEERLVENETYYQQLESAGMTYIELSDEDYKKMRENASEADEIVKKAMGEDLFNQMMAALGY